MENNLATELTSVSNQALEDLENMATVYGLDGLHDLVVAEMRSRPDFSPSSYDLMLVLEGC